MKIIIHRGTHEIGGSCVEILSKKSRILIDIGMPLVKKDGGRFNFKEYENTPGLELVDVKAIINSIGNARENSLVISIK